MQNKFERNRFEHRLEFWMRLFLMQNKCKETFQKVEHILKLLTNFENWVIFLKSQTIFQNTNNFETLNFVENVTIIWNIRIFLENMNK